MNLRDALFFRSFKFVSRLRYRLDRELEKVANKLLGRYFGGASGSLTSYQGVGRLESENTDRWKTLQAKAPRLTIVVVTYKQPEPLTCLLASLRCQTLQNFETIVLHDGEDDATRKVVDAHRLASGSVCRYIETPTRYNDYGHSLRGIGISAAEQEFVLVTNGDNYYSPRCVEFVFDAIDAKKLDLALWDIVHSHSNPGRNRNASNMAFQSYPASMRLDIGAFCVKTVIAQSVGFRDKTHDGDATYLQDILKQRLHPLHMGKIPKILMVHN